jgi:HEPN domain-containing protein
MTANELARSYPTKASVRLEMLHFLAERQAWSDVVREAQELVELALKGLLRQAGIDPPKWRDVGPVLLEQAALFPADLQAQLQELARISKRLRREREFAFYGDIDFVPTHEYSDADARLAIDEATVVVDAARRFID